jgi:hypothetical protein
MVETSRRRRRVVVVETYGDTSVRGTNEHRWTGWGGYVNRGCGGGDCREESNTCWIGSE